MATENYTDIGALFTRARKEMKLSIREASQALHIRARYLEAIEDGKLIDMPGAAYTKGYVQAYAAFLQLDKDEMLRRFKQIENTLPQRGFYFPEVFSKDKKPKSVAIWGGLAAALILYLLWLALFKPDAVELSIIEAPPSPESLAEAARPITMPNLRDVACISGPQRLYPACYQPADVSVDTSLLPVIDNVHSIMDLAAPQ